jgi:hypothetical protein
MFYTGHFMAYNEYQDVPTDLIPMTADLWSLQMIVIDIKETAKIRHDFQHLLASQEGAGRRLHPLGWESNFANTFRPDAKTLAGLAAEHKRLSQDALTYATQIKGNSKLGRFMLDNLMRLFPDIGYNASSGDALHKLSREDKSILQIFDQLGVGDYGSLIRFLKRPSGPIYW